jgi:hypothetical protein
MEKILTAVLMKKFRRFIFIAAVITLPSVVFAQTGISLETEIQNTAKTANSSGVSSLERHDSLVRLARLRQLSGDIEGAAKNWLEAAVAIPGQVDDDALLACAYCLAAMGEWERALKALDPLLVKRLRARFLYVGINALNTGNTSTLGEIAEAFEYSQMKSEIYYLLWKISNGSESEKWRQRLVSEFPQSPEARLTVETVSQIVLSQSPFWLFLGGLDSLPIAASEADRSSSTSAQGAVQTVSQANAPAQATAQTNINSSSIKLQAGLYSHESNAQSLAADLIKAGFYPSVEKRIVNSGEMWAVVVSSGSDANRTIRELREAGFDSFPLR